jgi:hypothetical protein
LALGLTGKMTATVAGETLTKQLKTIIKKLGKYPHSAIDFSNRKKQSTRMVKVTCADVECGMIFRTSAKWIETSGGALACPICHGFTNFNGVVTLPSISLGQNDEVSKGTKLFNVEIVEGNVVIAPRRAI